MSVDALVRWAVIFGAAVAAIAVLSFAIGRPVLSLLAPPATPAPGPTPSVPAATPATPAPPPATP